MTPEHWLEGRLDDAVALLTRDSMHMVSDAEGMPRLVTAPPLLLQLKLEISNSGNSGGGASSTTAAIPLAAAALDLMTDIETDVHDKWWESYHLHHGHGRGTLVGELRTWAAVCRVDEVQLRVAALMCTNWVRNIRGLLEPVRRWEIAGTCPACKADRVVVSEDVGSPVYGPALVIEFTEAGNRGLCRACHQDYEPEELARLMR